MVGFGVGCRCIDTGSSACLKDDADDIPWEGGLRALGKEGDDCVVRTCGEGLPFGVISLGRPVVSRKAVVTCRIAVLRVSVNMYNVQG